MRKRRWKAQVYSKWLWTLRWALEEGGLIKGQLEGGSLRKWELGAGAPYPAEILL